MGGRIDLARPVFWGMIALGSFAGALVVFPFNLWRARREPRTQPGSPSAWTPLPGTRSARGT
jgi:hypothetical protein